MQRASLHWQDHRAHRAYHQSCGGCIAHTCLPALHEAYLGSDNDDGSNNDDRFGPARMRSQPQLGPDPSQPPTFKHTKLYKALIGLQEMYLLVRLIAWLAIVLCISSSHSALGGHCWLSTGVNVAVAKEQPWSAEHVWQIACVLWQRQQTLLVHTLSAGDLHGKAARVTDATAEATTSVYTMSVEHCRGQ